MYHKVGVQKLSHNQILKLLRGERIRVKHGNHHEIHASEEQHKKIITAIKKEQEKLFNLTHSNSKWNHMIN